MILISGRWAAEKHPEAVEPQLWTRDIAAEYVADTLHAVHGQWVGHNDNKRKFGTRSPGPSSWPPPRSDSCFTRSRWFARWSVWLFAGSRATVHRGLEGVVGAQAFLQHPALRGDPATQAHRRLPQGRLLRPQRPHHPGPHRTAPSARRGGWPGTKPSAHWYLGRVRRRQHRQDENAQCTRGLVPVDRGVGTRNPAADRRPS
jgi:hypothetical protein